MTRVLDDAYETGALISPGNYAVMQTEEQIDLGIQAGMEVYGRDARGRVLMVPVQNQTAAKRGH